jgi:hypothetical protein
MIKAVLFVVLGLAVLAVIAVLYGEFRWKAGTRALRARLEAARLPIAPTIFDRREVESAPAPVQRYFRAVLEDGQPIVAAVGVEHAGTFNIGTAVDQWKNFTSTQRVVTRRPGFDWDARVEMMPGVSVHVHDTYIAGEGLLHAAAAGLLSMVNLRGPGELARGELMRFVAEAAWYPTALLPSQGVVWSAVDDHSARASFEDGAVALTLLFRFSADNLIETVSADSRGRTEGGKVVPTPWQCRLWNYAIRDGMRVPLDGEVAWLLPEGAKPYWRGHITNLRYEFAR